MKAGDYALGLEPSTSGFWGLKHALDNNIAQFLQPGESKTLHMSIEVLDDPEKIQSYISKCKESRKG